ncbi:MAG: hypothetical protein QX194_00640 [Methylococcales bacterium]
MKKYSQEYKTSAVKMVLKEGKNPTEVAHCLFGDNYKRYFLVN